MYMLFLREARSTCPTHGATVPPAQKKLFHTLLSSHMEIIQQKILMKYSGFFTISGINEFLLTITGGRGDGEKVTRSQLPAVCFNQRQ